MRCFEAPEPRQRIMVFVANPHREVQRRSPMVHAGPPEHGGARDRCPCLDGDRSQIRIGGSKTTAVVDCHREDADHLAGESDDAVIRGVHSSVSVSRQVGAPVSTESADGLESADYLPWNWTRQPGAGAGRYQHRHERDERNDDFDGVRPFPPPAVSSAYPSTQLNRRVSTRLRRRTDLHTVREAGPGQFDRQVFQLSVTERLDQCCVGAQPDCLILDVFIAGEDEDLGVCCDFGGT